jgi:excisionase family DNA binding protein
MSTAVQTRPLLTIQETAQRLAVSEKTVRRLIDAEILPALRLTSRTVRIDPDELASWLYDEASGGPSGPEAPAMRRAPDDASPAVEARPHAGEGR